VVQHHKTMKFIAFKKILPSILIIAVLAMGIFSVFNVSTVRAQENKLFSNYLNSGKYKKIAIHMPNHQAPKEKDETPPDSVFTRAETQAKAIEDPTTRIINDAAESEAKQKDTNRTGGAQNEEKGDTKSCTWYWWSISGCVNWAMTLVGQAVLSILAIFVGLTGWILDYVVTYTILEMGANVNGTDTVEGIGFIKEGWKMFRDLANIVIIFALLVIGIATILRIEGYGIKKLLSMLIVVALLINFSLFFTQVIIDASNLLAIQFYQKIIAINGAGWTGIGYAYMDAFKLTTLYNAKEVFDPQTLTKGLDFHQILLVSALGSVVFLVATFSFLAGAFLLIGRFVALIFLMVLSPLAFVGMILPATQSYASKWWSYLFKYSIFAPIYMILTWFVINIVSSGPFKKSIGLLDSTQLVGVAKGGALSINSFPIIMNFILVIFFMMASLLIANQMGIAGSSAVMKWGQSARKWGQGVAGRNTVGYAGQWARRGIEKGQKALEKTEPAGRVGSTFKKIGLATTRGAKKGAYGVEGFKYQSTQSKRDVVEVRDKDIEREIKERTGDPVQLAGHFTSLNKRQQQEAYRNMSARNRAALDEQLDTMEFGKLSLGAPSRTILNKVSKPLRDNLSTEEREKTIKSSKDAREDWENRETKKIIDDIAKTGATSYKNFNTKAPYTSDEIMKTLRSKQAHKLSHEARRSYAVVSRLKPTDLQDLMTNGNLTDDEIRRMKLIISSNFGTKAAQDYIASDNVKHLWDV